MPDPVSPPLPAAPAAPTAHVSRRRRWLVDGAILLAIAVGAHLMTGKGTISGNAPSLEGTGVDGSPLSLAALKGQPVLVQFWATWCGVCHQEAPTIDRLNQDHRVLTVAVDSGGADKILAFQAQHGEHWPILADPEGRLAASWGVSAFPSSFVIDGQGKIRFVEVGYTTELGLRARLWLARLLS